MVFLAYPVEPTGCGAAHSKYCREKRENRCGDVVVYVKTETKPFTQNVYLLNFLEGHLSPLHSRLAQESCMFRKPCKMNVSSTLKKNVSRRFFCIPLHLMFLNEKSALCDWFLVLCIKLHIYIRGVTIHVFVLNHLVQGFRFGTHYKLNDSLD